MKTPERSRATHAPSVAGTAPPLSEAAPSGDSRQPWVAPRLECFGDLRQLTMGPTPGVGESGNPAIRKA